MLTVRYEPPRPAAGRPAARPRLRLRPPRLRGGPARRPRGGLRLRRGRAEGGAQHLRRHGRRRRGRPRLAAPAPSQGDATRLPFADGTFDRIIASEVLEHIADDEAAMGELARVLRPGGTMAVTVPTLAARRRSAGRCPTSTTRRSCPAATCASTGSGELREQAARRRRARPGFAHHAHALHSPYWWLRCAVGPTNDDHPLVARLPQGARVGHRQGPGRHPLGRPRC